MIDVEELFRAEFTYNALVLCIHFHNRVRIGYSNWTTGADS